MITLREYFLYLIFGYNSDASADAQIGKFVVHDIDGHGHVFRTLSVASVQITSKVH